MKLFTKAIAIIFCGALWPSCAFAGLFFRPDVCRNIKGQWHTKYQNEKQIFEPPFIIDGKQDRTGSKLFDPNKMYLNLSHTKTNPDDKRLVQMSLFSPEATGNPLAPKVNCCITTATNANPAILEISTTYDKDKYKADINKIFTYSVSLLVRLVDVDGKPVGGVTYTKVIRFGLRIDGVTQPPQVLRLGSYIKADDNGAIQVYDLDAVDASTSTKDFVDEDMLTDNPIAVVDEAMLTDNLDVVNGEMLTDNPIAVVDGEMLTDNLDVVNGDMLTDNLDVVNGKIITDNPKERIVKHRVKNGKLFKPESFFGGEEIIHFYKE